MPSDWQRALIALSATVVTTAILALLYWARSIFIPITLAIFLAFVLAPVVARVQRFGLGRTTAVIATVGFVIITSVGVGALVVQQVVQLAETLPDRRETIKEKVAAAKEWLVGNNTNRFGPLIDDVSGVIAPKQPQQQAIVVETTSPLAAQVDSYISPAVEVVGQAAFTFILTVYMLLRREDLRNRMIRLLGAGKITTTTKAVDDASRRISSYLLSQLVVNSAFGLIIAVGLFALGVKYSILWGFIATLMRYVPYVGTWVGLIPPVLFSFATAPAWGGGWGQPIAVLVLFLGLEAFCNNVVEPQVYGQSMGLSEVAQLVAAAVWAFLWGPMGLILSGPLTVCILVLGRHVSRFNFFVVLLGDEPALEARVAFYQRLAARDQDEAADVAVEEAKKTSPEAVFDDVIIPALTLARNDQQEGDLGDEEMNYIVTAAREVAEEVAELRTAPAGNSDERIRVLLCPARDKTELLAAELLAMTLDPSRWEVKVAGVETLASELVELVASFRPAVVVVTAMPPGGLSHARYLLTRLRRRFPELRMLVGRWGEPLVPELNTEAIKNADGVDRTLAETRKRLGALHPLLVSATAKPAVERVNKMEVVGTAGA